MKKVSDDVFEQPATINNHGHARKVPEITERVLFEADRVSSALLCMTNLVDESGRSTPVDAPEGISQYDDYLDARKPRGSQLRTYSLATITPQMTPDMVRPLKEAGAIGLKFLPSGMTTGSGEGIADPRSIIPILKAAAACNLPWMPHCEKPGMDPNEAVNALIPWLDYVVHNVLGLRTIVAHTNTKRLFEWGADLPKTIDLAFEVAAHYMMRSNADQAGPHWKCKPLYGDPEDMAAVQLAGLAGEWGSRLVIWGEDVAPHWYRHKSGENAPFGVFLPDDVAFAWLVEFFEQSGHANWKRRLEQLTFHNASKWWWGTSQPTQWLRVKREDWVVPTLYEAGIDSIVCPLGGTTLKWKATKI